MDHKKIFESIKAMFSGPSFTPAPVIPAEAAIPAPAAIVTGTIYKLMDGTEISITMAGPEPAVGDLVTVASSPAPAGDYELEDGSKITVDGTGAITMIVIATPITQPEFVQPVAKTLEERISAIEGRINAPLTMAAIEGAPGLTAEMVAEMYAKFAIGTTEERIGNLEVMIKALMDCNFGYQIRQGHENEAIRVYKEALTPMQTTMSTQATQLQAAEATITKHEKTITGLFDLVEKLVNEPTTEPVTLTGAKKDKFDRQAKRNDRLEIIAETIKKNRALA